MSKLSFQTTNQIDWIDIKSNANIDKKLVVNKFMQTLFLMLLKVGIEIQRLTFYKQKQHI